VTVSAVVIVSGPPGAGKSTIARLLAQRYARAVHLHTDDFWDAVVAGRIAPYLPEADAQNHTVVRAAAAAARGYAAGGYTVVVDGVVGAWMLAHYRDACALEPHVDIQYVVLRPDKATTVARALSRTAADALTESAPVMDLWDQFSALGPLEAHAYDSSAESAEDTAETLHRSLAEGAYRLVG
jgi:predicted kinase